jgi:alanine racemase
LSSNIRLTIDLSAIVENWRRLSEKSFPAECAAVVKADAYGLGLEHVVPPLIAAGCRSFFVAHLEEGLDLRDLSSKVDIYILNGIPAGEERAAFAANLIPVVNGLAELSRLQKTKKGVSAPIAINIDTGIHRLGLDESEVEHLKHHRDLAGDMWIKLAMSHLVTSETPNHPLNRRQRERFCNALPEFIWARLIISIWCGLVRLSMA